ncbi:hypothetical protein GCM10020220_057160 [Nonomuraea rubra]
MRHWNDPQVRRYLFDDREVDPRLAESLLRDSEADFARRGYGLWQSSWRTCSSGVCGLRRPRRGAGGDPLQPGSRVPGRRAGGRGGPGAWLAAGRRARLKEILIETDDGNVSSQRLAERLGAVFESAEEGCGATW